MGTCDRFDGGLNSRAAESSSVFSHVGGVASGSVFGPRCHRRSAGARGFTVIELLVIVLIIGVLMALLVPALFWARASSRTATCAAGLRQWGMALQMYLPEHNQLLPRIGSTSERALAGAWYNELPHYVSALPYKAHYDGSSLGDAEGYPNNWIWHCPTRIASDRKHSGSATNAFHYGMSAVLNGTNTFGPNLTASQPFTNTRIIDHPARTVFMGESFNNSFISPAVTGNAMDRSRHDGGANLLFLDGRVELLSASQVPEPTQQDGVWQSGDPLLIWGPFRH